MKPFTGKHMTTILVVFFGVVISVNVVMARLAVGTFGGTVVENSYVASQEFNGWLAKARQQDALGWQANVTLNKDRFVSVEMRDGSARPLDGSQVILVASHPLGRLPSFTMHFVEQGKGVYRSKESLPDGRWHGRLELRRDGHVMKLAETLS